LVLRLRRRRTLRSLRSVRPAPSPRTTGPARTHAPHSSTRHLCFQLLPLVGSEHLPDAEQHARVRLLQFCPRLRDFVDLRQHLRFIRTVRRQHRFQDDFLLLHGGNLVTAPEDSSEFMAWGSHGAGRWVAVFGNSGHAYMDIAGLRLDTSAADDPANQQGPRWRPLRTENGGYTVRHPLGL